MPVKERLIEEIEKLASADVLEVYELVLDLKRERSHSVKGETPAYLQVQDILRKCPGSLADDIRLLREDRV